MQLDRESSPPRPRQFLRALRVKHWREGPSWKVQIPDCAPPHATIIALVAVCWFAGYGLGTRLPPAEVRRLRAGIRAHRDSSGQERSAES
jgi:hypothetical protein